MASSSIRLVKTLFEYVSFITGLCLNSLLVWLIRTETPTPMLPYSRILLQTCFTDIAMLAVNAFVCEFFIPGPEGIEIVVGGWVSVDNPDWRWWNLLMEVAKFFFTYVSLFGFVVQFLYRFLTLNKNKHIKLRYYFAMLTGVLVFPFSACVWLYVCYYPSPEHTRLQNAEAAKQFRIEPNTTLAGFNDGTGSVIFALYYILALCTVAEASLVLLGWRMVVFVRRNLKGATNQQRKTLDTQSQVTRTLIIQALLPSFIYANMWYVVAISQFSVNVGPVLSAPLTTAVIMNIPMYAPALLNPAVTIACIRPYRESVTRWTKRFVRSLLRCFCTTTNNNVQGTASVAVVVHIGAGIPRQ